VRLRRVVNELQHAHLAYVKELLERLQLLQHVMQ
jgi:hypothetical protein